MEDRSETKPKRQAPKKSLSMYFNPNQLNRILNDIGSPRDSESLEKYHIRRRPRSKKKSMAKLTTSAFHVSESRNLLPRNQSIVRNATFILTT